MGMLRILLAISVIFTHSGGASLVGGRNAVQIFYMISGFLMSYVVTQRKGYSTNREFYLSRYLRLFPQYIFIAAITLLYFAFSDGPEARAFFDIFRENGTFARVWLAIANIALFSQDWVMFVGERGGHLAFEPVLLGAPAPLYRGLLLPQSWTLGVELTFYAIAPFVMPRRRLILALLAASIGIRIALFAMGLAGTDPWTYRFFPTELALFLIGALSHQLLTPIHHKLALDRQRVAITAAIVTAVLVYAWVPGRETVKSAALMLSVAVSLPALFGFQHGRKWDQWIGALSYPIYINHVTVVSMLSQTPIGSHPGLLAGTTVALAILFAIVMNRFIGDPVDVLRHRLRMSRRRGTG